MRCCVIRDRAYVDKQKVNSYPEICRKTKIDSPLDWVPIRAPKPCVLWRESLRTHPDACAARPCCSITLRTAVTNASKLPVGFFLPSGESEENIPCRTLREISIWTPLPFIPRLQMFDGSS